MHAIHVLCVAVWISGLFLFAKTVLQAMPDPAGRAALDPIRRFSNVALAAVVIIFATGVVNILLIGPEFSLDGRYAHVLEIKIGLVFAMLGFAAFNRLRLTPQLRDGGTGAH